jgi:hypothetical protein
MAAALLGLDRSQEALQRLRRRNAWQEEYKMYCGPYSAGVVHSVSDQIQNLQNCFTTPNKMTTDQ